MPEFPFVSIEGGPEDRGFQYGRAAGELIAIGFEFYREEFARRGVRWEAADRTCQALLDQIELFDPDSKREICSIARGAEQPVEAIVALNARTEILNTHRQADGAITTAECSAVAVLPSVTREGRLLHGQNWDWLDDAVHHTLVLQIRESDGAEILTLAEAGQLARSGMNKAGLALTVNGLHTNLDRYATGVCSPVIRRNLLRKSTLADAAGVVMKAPRNYSHNFMISHAHGMAIDLETTPEHVFWLIPEDGVLVHANHFKDAAAKVLVVDEGVRRSPDSLFREMAIQHRLDARTGPIDLELIKAAFADRTGDPHGVLQPPSSDKSGIPESTVATVIFDPAAGKMWVARTPYKTPSFQEFSFD